MICGCPHRNPDRNLSEDALLVVDFNAPAEPPKVTELASQLAAVMHHA